MMSSSGKLYVWNVNCRVWDNKHILDSMLLHYYYQLFNWFMQQQQKDLINIDYFWVILDIYF